MGTLGAATRRPTRGLRVALLGGIALAGCVVAPPAASPPSAPESWSWFASPSPDDPWISSISDWQAREQGRGPLVREPSVETAGVLAHAFAGFRAEQRRALAREVARWIQEQAERHFVPDVGNDYWPTFAEVLARGRDDCDGLALLTYHMLRDFGFGDGELYQAIVQSDTNGQLHMVTLWFEDPADPWVIDPTAAMVKPMQRMSEVRGWRPVELFTETHQFAVTGGPQPPLAPPPHSVEPAAR